MKLLIKNATLLDMVGEAPNIKKTDILIEKNKIAKISENIVDEEADVIDAKEKVVMPGLVNTHTHLAMSIFRGYKDDQKLMDWLENAIFPVEDRLSPDDIYWNSFLSCIELIKSGTTTFNDMYFRMDKTIESVEESGLRGVIAWCITDTSIKDKITRTREYHEKYNYPDSKIKIYVSAHAPYSCSPDTIQLCVDLAKELNTGIHKHLSETLQEDKIIRERYNKTGTEYLNDLHVFDVPVVLAHGIYISDKDLEILKHIPIEDYNKIPRNEIELFETYADKDFTFNYDSSKTLEEQNVSNITKGIIILLFRDYWATEIQRNKIVSKQNYDRVKLEEKKKEKYNPDNIFINNHKNSLVDIPENKQEKSLVKIDDIKWYKKIWNRIKSFFEK